MRMVIVIGGALLLVYAMLPALYRAAGLPHAYALQRHTAAFLDQAKAGRFEAARLLLDADATDGSWTQAMAELNEAGLRLASYRHVKAEFDDGGYNTGHVDLVWELRGKPLETKALVAFRPGGKPGQVCVIPPLDTERGSIPELERWNMLVCGASH